MTPERFAVLQALLAYLLARCGEEREATIPADELVERFRIPPEELEEHLSLLNLVNFGGGCYTVYAELDGAQVHVDKELYGETFRAAPRLTPLEARAIRLALEYVGPMIAAEAHTPLERVRRKLEETFGQFELAQTPEPHGDDSRGELRLDVQRRRSAAGGSSRSSTRRRARRRRRRASSSRTCSSASSRTGRAHVGPHARRRAELPARPDARARSCTSERFEPREGFEPSRLRDARTARVLYTRSRALGARARRASARRRGRRRRYAGRQRRVARERDLLLPRRGGRARARRPAHAHRATARRSSRASSASNRLRVTT